MSVTHLYAQEIAGARTRRKFEGKAKAARPPHRCSKKGGGVSRRYIRIGFVVHFGWKCDRSITRDSLGSDNVAALGFPRDITVQGSGNVGGREKAHGLQQVQFDVGAVFLEAHFVGRGAVQLDRGRSRR